MSAIEQLYGNNPLFKQAKEMVMGKSPQQISETIQNVCKTRGVNYEEIKSMAQSFGIYI
jgi:hypothetical protein